MTLVSRQTDMTEHANQRRVLVVEDDEHLVRFTRLLLERDGWQVSAATTVQEALNFLVHNQVHVILCDVMLPGADGYQLLAELHSSNYNVPVVLMTAYSSSARARRALREGALDFVPKPFSSDRLLSALHSASLQSHVGPIPGKV